MNPRPRLPVPWLDVVLAVVLAVAGLANTLADRAALHPLVDIAAFVVAGSVALRTRAPLVMAGIAAVFALLLPGVDGALWMLAAVLVIAFSIGLHASGRPAAVAVAVLLASTMLLQSRTADLLETIVSPALLVVGSALVGLLVRLSRAQTARLREMTEAIERERGEQAELAAEAERARIRRDLHDILGHTLSTITVQAGAAEQLVPHAAAARPSIEAISSGARAGMGDVRSLLALARGEHPVVPLARSRRMLPPPPSASRRLPPWWDVLIAVVIGAAAWLESPKADPGWHAVAVVVISVVIAGSIVLRTTSPLVMAVVVAAGAPALGLLTRESLPLWGFAMLLLVLFSLAARLRGRRAVIGIGLVLAGTYLIPDDQPSLLGKVVAPLIIAGAPVVAGVLLRRSRERTTELQVLSARLDAERDRHAQLAAEAERVRIADDVHDVLAHTLSTIAVQAAAAQQLLAEGHAAREPVDHIVTEARRGIAELRALLDSQRADGAARTEPGPSLDQVVDLVRAGGASLVARGMPAPLQDGVSLTAFRVVQEALTNARKHAPGRQAIVTLDWRADVLGLTVENDGLVRPGTAGRGLIGMAERVAAYSGDLQVGPGEGGSGWLVRATLPYARAAGERA